MRNVFYRYAEQITIATKSLFKKQDQLQSNNLFLDSTITNKASQLRTQANKAQAAKLISGSGNLNRPF